MNTIRQKTAVILLMILLGACQTGAVKSQTFSDSTEIGRMLNEILGVVEFGRTTQEEVGQKLCGRKFGIYPEDLDRYEQDFVSRMADIKNPYKTDCPAMSDQWENAAQAMNSVQIVYDGQDKAQLAIYNFFYGHVDNEMDNVFRIFGEPALVYQSVGSDSYYFAYPERGFSIRVFLMATPTEANSSWEISSESSAEQVLLFEPMSMRAYQNDFVDSSDVIIEDWEIVQTNYLD